MAIERIHLRTNLLRINLLLLLVGGLLGLKAQAPNLAPTPRLGVPPNSYGLTIQYQPKAVPHPKPANAYDAEVEERLLKQNPPLITAQIVRASDRRKETDRFSDGSETVKFVLGNLLLIDARVSHAISIQTAQNAGFDFKKDFFDLAWIEHAEYQGLHDYQGTPCHVYHAKGTEPRDEKTAYIDAKSGLPRAIETPELTTTYIFRSSTEVPELPEELARHYEMYQTEQGL